MNCSTKFIPTFGYFAEKNGSLVFEGAEGATKIARLIESYATDPFPEVLGLKGHKRQKFRDRQRIEDVEGDQIPKEKMLMFELEDRSARSRCAPSGTEPKIKYYLFAHRRPEKWKIRFCGTQSNQDGSGRETRSSLGLAAKGCSVASSHIR